MVWINTKTNLPKKHTGTDIKNDILFSYGDFICMGYFDGFSFISEGEPYPALARHIETWWMPLPELPR